MVYDPNAPVDREKAVAAQRERLYWLTLLSGLGNAVLLALHLIGAETILVPWIAAGVAGALITAGIRGISDGYYNDLVSVGLRWMAFALGVLTLLLWINADLSLLVFPWVDRLADDGFLLALVLGLAFHAGYAFAYIKDIVWKGSEL